MLANAALRQLKEEDIDKTVDGILDFLANAYAQIEKVKDAPAQTIEEITPASLVA